MIASSVNSSNFFGLSNRFWDYVPIASSVTNLVTLFKKHAYQAPKEEAQVQRTYEYTYIKNKSFLRCIVLLVPFIGNLTILIFDFIAQCFNPKKFGIQPKAPKDPSAEFQNLELVEIHREGRVVSNVHNLRDAPQLESRMKLDNEAPKHAVAIADSLTEKLRFYLEEMTSLDNEFSLMGPFNGCGAVFQRQASEWYSRVISEILEAIRKFDLTCQTREKDLYAPGHNGFTNLVRNQGMIKYHRLIDMRTLHSHPEAFTGLLGLEAGIGEKLVPNWTYTIHLMKFILLRLYGVQRPQEYWKTPVLVDERMRTELLAICGRMKIHYQKLFRLLEEIDSNIFRLREPREAFCKLLQDNFQINKAKTGPRLRELQQSFIEVFSSDISYRNLVADQKFFLRNLFTPQVFQEQIRRSNPQMAEDICQSKFLLFKADKMNLQPRWQSEICDHSVQHLLSKPAFNRSLLNTRMMKVFFDACFRQSKLILDLSNRQVAWIPNTPTKHEVVVADLDTFVLNPENGLFVTPRNFFKPVVRAAIEALTPPTANYRNTYISLANKYLSYINKVVKMQPIEAENPLNYLSTGEIVTPVKGYTLPLIIPKSMLRELEKNLTKIQNNLSHVKMGALAPFYEFSTTTGELSIVYQHIDPFIVRLNPRPFASFIVAKFDPLTINSFQHDLLRRSPEFDPSEFLLQAFYGSVHTLGLPGKGSFQLKSGLIAPEEIPFPGCYRLWEQNPNRAIVYNSKIYDGSQAAIDQMMTQEPMMVPGQDYEAIHKQVAMKKQELIFNQDEHKRLFQVLRALVNLGSSMPWEVFTQKLSQIGISENLETLFDHAEIQPMDREAVSNLQRELLEMPSLKLQELRDLVTQLDNGMEWIRVGSRTVGVSSDQLQVAVV